MRKVTLAKSAGFCYGVKRAVDLAGQAVEQGRSICWGRLSTTTMWWRSWSERGLFWSAVWRRYPRGLG